MQDPVQPPADLSAAPSAHAPADVAALSADAQQQRESLIDYPAPFPIKVVGENADGFVGAVTHIARQFDPTFDASTIALRESGGGKYLGVTITVLATSRQQLDDLYRALSTHPQARWVL